MVSQPSNKAVMAQQAKQAALTKFLAQQVAAAFELIDISDLRNTLPRFQQVIAALVRRYGAAAAALAARFYADERAKALGTPTLIPTPADPPDPAAVIAGLAWATKGLWGSPDDVDMDAVRVLAQGVAQKHVVDTARATVMDAVRSDSRAHGWGRQARPDACSFCALLSTRGGVYKTKASAAFDAHSHCHCIPVPFWAADYQQPEYVTRWQELYKQSTAGKSSGAARNAFRVALADQRSE